MIFWVSDPNQSNPRTFLKISTQSNPIQSNPWMDPIHVQLCAGGSGRQHRPTEPTNTTLRCSDVEALGTPGPVCEVAPSLVKVPRSRSGAPGIKVNGPGKFVEPRSQGGLVGLRCTWKAAELGVEPASVNAAGVSGSVDSPRTPVLFPQYYLVSASVLPTRLRQFTAYVAIYTIYSFICLIYCVYDICNTFGLILPSL